jgi:hypothetical protein
MREDTRFQVRHLVFLISTNDVGLDQHLSRNSDRVCTRVIEHCLDNVATTRLVFAGECPMLPGPWIAVAIAPREEKLRAFDIFTFKMLRVAARLRSFLRGFEK